MEPRKDERQAAGESFSTDGIQRRAAHGPFGQRQAGELMSMSGMMGELLINFKLGLSSQCLNVCRGSI